MKEVETQIKERLAEACLTGEAARFVASQIRGRAKEAAAAKLDGYLVRKLILTKTQLIRPTKEY